MKLQVPIAALTLITSLAAEEAPKIFSGLFEQNVPVKGSICRVLPPEEILKYVAKVETAAKKDTKWFREYSKLGKPGEPLAYDERLGLTKEEYDEYLVLWNKRGLVDQVNIMLSLRQSVGETWLLTATGEASVLSTLRYLPKDDLFRSPNGDLKRIADIKANPASILGEWSGAEWKFEEETEFGKTKENFAIGRFADNKTGIIVHRVQEISPKGAPVLDNSLIIRFPLGKAGQIVEKPPVPGKTTPAKPAPGKSTSNKAAKPATRK